MGRRCAPEWARVVGPCPLGQRLFPEAPVLEGSPRPRQGQGPGHSQAHAAGKASGPSSHFRGGEWFTFSGNTAVPCAYGHGSPTTPRRRLRSGHAGLLWALRRHSPWPSPDTAPSSPAHRVQGLDVVVMHGVRVRGWRPASPAAEPWRLLADPGGRRDISLEKETPVMPHTGRLCS